MTANPQRTVRQVQAAIFRRAQSAQRQVEGAQKKLNAVRDECTHPFAVKINRGNTGNYDPSADCYWKDCSCPDCGKVWQEDQ